MITATIQEILAAADTLGAILQDTARVKALRPHVSRYIGVRMLRAINDALKPYFEEHNAAILEYKFKDDKNQNAVPERFRAEFQQRVNEMRKDKCDIAGIHPLREVDLYPLDLTPIEWSLLDFLIEPYAESDEKAS
jgi:hypothetical protein